MFTTYSSSDINCFGNGNGIIEIGDAQGGNGPYNYELLGIESNSTGLFNGLDPGVYSVIITDALGCMVDTTIQIEEPEPLFIQSQNFDILCGEDIILDLITNVDIEDIQSIVWSNGNGLSCVDCLNTIISIIASTTYTVSIITNDGCEVSAQISIDVEDESELYAPNIFAPASTTGNETFYLTGNDRVEEVLDFYIYDRWGNNVFEAHNFEPNDKEFGWDGKFKGVLGVPGVYVFFANYKGCSDDVSKLVGDVTLLR